MTSQEESRKYRSAAHKQKINIHGGTYNHFPNDLCFNLQEVSCNTRCQDVRGPKQGKTGVQLGQLDCASTIVMGSFCKQHIVLNHVFFRYKSSGRKIRGSSGGWSATIPHRENIVQAGCD